MCTARYLLLASIGVGLLVVAASSQGQAPPAETLPVVIPADMVSPGAAARLGAVLVGSRDQRDVEADRQVQSLLKQLGEAKDEVAKTEVQKKLTEALGKQFDVRQENRERELKELEERVKRLRDVLDKRQKAKDAIVRSHLDQLLRDAEGLGWGDASPDGIKHFPGGAGGFGIPARK